MVRFENKYFRRNFNLLLRWICVCITVFLVVQNAFASYHSDPDRNPILRKVFSQAHQDFLKQKIANRHFSPTSVGPAPRITSTDADSLFLDWSNSYSTGIRSANDLCSGLCVDPQDGSVYVVGASNSETTGFDYFIVKYSSKGGMLWTRRYDGASHGDDYAIAVAIGASRNIYVTGFSMDADSVFDFLTLKCSSTGSIQWVRTYDGPGQSDDTPTGIVIDPSENIYVTGNSIGADSTYDIATIKYTSAGGQQWAVRYGLSDREDDNAVGILLDASRNICIGGNSRNSESYSQYITLKYNSSGTQLWVALSGRNSNQSSEMTGIAVDVSGAIGVTGKTYSDLSGYDYYTVVYNLAGTNLWTVRYDGTEGLNDEGSAIGFDSQGSAYVTGASEGAYGTYDFVTLKYDQGGNRKWTKRYSVNNSDGIPFVMAIDPLDNVYISRTSSNGGSSYDFATLKYNSLGVLQWITYYDSPSNAYDYPTGLQLDRFANIYLCGVSSTHGINSFNTMRYNQYPNLVFETAGLSFSETGISCALRDTISLVNTGSSALNVSAIHSPLADFSVSPASASISALSRQIFIVTFAPLSSGTKATDIGFANSGKNNLAIMHVTGKASGSGIGTNVSTSLGTGWQLISLPVKVNCPVTLENSAPYSYANGYSASESMIDGIGYWQKLNASDVSFTGYALSQETVQVHANWNLVGSVSFPISVSQMQTMPGNIIKSQIFGYNGLGYVPIDTIYPCHAFWVKVSQPGQLVIGTSINAIPKKLLGTLSQPNNFLMISDAAGKMQKLYLSAEGETSTPGLNELPPPPPRGVFDARFSSGRYLESLQNNTAEIPVAVSGGQYPMTISWEILAGIRNLSLLLGDRVIPITTKGSIEISSPSEITVLYQPEKGRPTQFALSQNFPNPFNPTTTIHYELPTNAHVSLKIIDLLGREVYTLVDEEKLSGIYNIDFNAGNLSSGVYFYRLSAGDFTQIRKMAVIK